MYKKKYTNKKLGNVVNKYTTINKQRKLISNSTKQLLYNYNQQGGGIPYSDYHIFDEFPLDGYGLYTNPLYGCAWMINVVPNYYRFNCDSDIGMFIHDLFTAPVIDDIVPSKSGVLEQLTSNDIGRIIGYYLLKGMPLPTTDYKNLLIADDTNVQIAGEFKPCIKYQINDAAEQGNVAGEHIAKQIKVLSYEEKFGEFKKIVQKHKKLHNTVEFFHIILAFFWSRINNIDEVKDYISGLLNYLKTIVNPGPTKKNTPGSENMNILPVSASVNEYVKAIEDNMLQKQVAMQQIKKDDSVQEISKSTIKSAAKKKMLLALNNINKTRVANGKQKITQFDLQSIIENNPSANRSMSKKSKLEPVFMEEDEKEEYKQIYDNIGLDESSLISKRTMKGNNETRQKLGIDYIELNEEIKTAIKPFVSSLYTVLNMKRPRDTGIKHETITMLINIISNTKPFEIIKYETAHYLGNSFPDCMETTIRNICNALIFDKVVNVSELSPDFKEFYETYNTMQMQVSKKSKLFKGSSYSARDAWALLVSGQTANQVTYGGWDGVDGPFNMWPTANNLYRILCMFFGLEISEDIKTKIDAKLKTFNVKIKDTTKMEIGIIKIIINGKTMKVVIQSSHAYIEMDQKLQSDIESLSSKYMYLYNLLKIETIFDGFDDEEDLMPFNENLTESLNKKLLLQHVNEEILRKFTEFCGYNYHIMINFGRLFNIYKHVLYYLILTGSQDLLRRLFLTPIMVNFDLHKLPNDKLSALCVKYNKENNLEGIKLDILLNELKDNRHIKELTLGDRFNEYLDNVSLPHGITYLKFGDKYNRDLFESSIPDTVEYLLFGKKFEKKITKEILPTGLKYIRLGDLQTDITEDMFPDSLEELDTGDVFNFEITSLPKNLKKLVLGKNFNYIHPGALPEGLTHIIFGMDYNSSLKGLLPNSLTNLIFGYNYTRKLKPRDLPNNITHLTFGATYNHPLTKSVLPKKLKYLKLGHYYGQEINVEELPESLEELVTDMKLPESTLEKLKERNINVHK